MKKTAFLLVLVILISIFQVSALAVNYEIGETNVSAAVGEEIDIPIVLKNNKGLMGFRISVSYNPEELDVVAVKKGDVIDGGNYYTNFGNSDTGFDVLWNSTENVIKDGTLFTISVKLKSKTKNEAKIKLSSGKGDTFDGMWNDVELNCHEITVKKSAEKKTTQPISQTETNTQDVNSVKMPSDEAIVEAFKTALKNTDYESVYDAAGDKAFIDSVNKKLSESAGIEDRHWITDYDTAIQIYEQAYENIFFNTVRGTLKSEDVNSAVQEVMKNMQISSVSEIPEEKEEKFVKEVQKRLNKLSPEMPDVEGDVDTDEAMKLFKQAYGLANGGVPQKVEVSERNDGRIIVIATVGAAAIIAAVTAIIIYKKKSKNNKEEKAK
ncbi:MAG: cohesin domain-containing protein [Monoglobaceae bacterium]